MNDRTQALSAVPPSWAHALAAALQAGERAVAWFELNLDAELRFGRGLVVLTSERLLVGRGNPGSLSARWQSWPLAEVASVRADEVGGLGSLSIFGQAARLEIVHFVPPADARAFADRFNAYTQGLPVEPQVDDEPELIEATAETPHAGLALLRLGRFARSRFKLVLLGFVLTLATTAAGLIPPYLTMPLLDEVLIPYQNEAEQLRRSSDLDAHQVAQALTELQRRESPRMRLVALYLAGLGGAATAAWLLSWAQGVVMARVSERIGMDLRNRTYEHLQKLSLDFFGRKRTGDLISRISSDTDRICTFLSDNLVDFATDCLMIVGTSAILLAIDPVLAVATLVPFPLIGWLIYRVRGRLQSGFRRGGRAFAEMTSVLADTIPGIRVVKAFAQERREIERFRRANLAVIEANDRVNTVWTFFWPLVVMLNQLGLLVVWAFGAARVFDHQITVGVLTAFLAYIGRFYTRLESMSRMFSATQRAGACTQRIFEILDRVPNVPDPANPVPTGRLRGEIELRNVGFRYGARSILQGVDLHIAPGEMIGLVGPSGAGKSTLVNLVCRFYDVAEGSILVDGVDIRNFELADYRRHIGIVLQDPFLFYGTVAENIAYGKPDATRDEIVAAARAARAHDFILRLPDGYDSLVGERGQALSGGERQRISIARALLIDPRILILDEATSSVDTETEREIQEALDNLIQGRTTIAIAHRLSTLRRADRLIVLDRGQIVETGQHQELLQTPGVYARLHKAQLEMAAEALP
ncbi:MAG: ABC transporter ATP-binding protein/permease [Pirellulales bacterium]|nr:ABC transporter ATP-binding protein/permease [Pirellulales bacterium]